MAPVSIVELEKALKCRARKGRDAPGAKPLGDLELVRRQLRDGVGSHVAVDRVLWNAIREVPTSGFERGAGGFRRTPDAIRCFLAIYGRLELQDTLRSDGDLTKARLFPDNPPGGHGERSTRYAKIMAFDRLGAYPEEAMCAALSCAKKGAIERHSKGAPQAIAKALHAQEAKLRGVPSTGARAGERPAASSMAGKVQAAEDDLHASGLLPSFRKTKPVREPFEGLIRKLREPLGGYANAGAQFAFVVEQLDALVSMLQGISVSEDISVNGNEDYVKKQFSTLERGIDIERIFLYEDADKSQMLKAMTAQKREADRAGKRAHAKGRDAGVYKPYLLERSKAMDVDPQGEFLSTAIIDRNLPTRRVVRQRFAPEGHLTYREVTVSPAEVERAIDHFVTLRENSKEG
jgi:hypothetical protein